MAKLIIKAFLLLFFFYYFSLLASASSPEFSPFVASIDCGGTEPFIDERSISWVPDSSLITTGEPRSVPAADSFSLPMRTLRVFATGIRNCYNIGVPGGGERQVLVRASFLYGNYDRRSLPPRFDLEFDGSRWGTVETAVMEVVRHEAVYAVRGGATRVCVVRTRHGEVPFVSAIEVRGLADRMYGRGYNRSSSALVLAGRMAIGTTSVVRYPDDSFDRIWMPTIAGGSLEVVDNAAITVSAIINDMPPEAVLQAAAVPAKGLKTITLVPPLSPVPVPVYINLYFTEVAALAANESRSFVVYLDDAAASEPIAPPLGGVLQFYLINVTASGGTRIRLRQTLESTLPPIISAMEAFVVVERGQGGDADISYDNGEVFDSKAEL